MAQHIFIIGSKGIPGAYGGYETFVDKLTEYHEDCKAIKYHVACKGKKELETEYHNAHCFTVKVPDIGAAQAIYYDVKALQFCLRYIKLHKIENPIVYILACRIGPFSRHYLKKVHKFGGKVYVNPDGHEWKRSKWNYFVRKYWKLSERLMVKNSDLLICDSVNIEKYIHKEYNRFSPCTTYISYGAEIADSESLDSGVNNRYREWLAKNHVTEGQYYLIVGRFVPENNYETMIREFMNSVTSKKLVIICNKNEKLQQELETILHFEQDDRICFAGTVYDKGLLMEIRKHAYGYIHGHEVGGTNPSLLEALGSTNMNLLLDIGFNKEVAKDGALYWNKQQGNLKGLIDRLEDISNDQANTLGKKAKKRICEAYSWEQIAGQYLNLFTKEIAES